LNQKNFYEEYWRERETKGLVAVREGMRVPPRIQIACAMISKRANPLYCIDIGCGDGIIGKLLKEQFGDNIYIVGCDISGKAIKYASSYYNEVLQIDIESGELGEKLCGRKFDYIVCLEVLEHLFRPEKLLKQCQTILKDDGEIIVSFPNIAWYKYRISMLRGKFPKNYLLYPGEHIWNFTLYSFEKLLRENNFIPIEMDGHFKFLGFFKHGHARMFGSIFKKFPNLFGYQLVVRARAKEA
jgi:2-polyprenyl-3-methyl-5-hydroxy-6-metoxy-1,4-benzoquinol methylase